MEINQFALIDEITFEDFVRDCFNLKYETKDFEIYGIKGQKQDGIDIYSPKFYCAIQCKYIKNSKISNHKSCRDSLKKIIDNEIKKIKASKQKIETYYIVSTYCHDKALIDFCSTKKQENHLTYDVKYIGGEELLKLSNNAAIINKYFPEIAKANDNLTFRQHINRGLDKLNSDYWQCDFVVSNKTTFLNFLPKHPDSHEKEPLTFNFTLSNENDLEKFNKFYDSNSYEDLEHIVKLDNNNIKLSPLLEQVFSSNGINSIYLKKLPSLQKQYKISLRIIKSITSELVRLDMNINYYSSTMSVLSIESDYYPFSIIMIQNGDDYKTTISINCSSSELKPTIELLTFMTNITSFTPIVVIDANNDQEMFNLPIGEISLIEVNKLLEQINLIYEFQRLIPNKINWYSYLMDNNYELLLLIMECKNNNYAVIKSSYISLNIKENQFIRDSRYIIMMPYVGIEIIEELKNFGQIYIIFGIDNKAMDLIMNNTLNGEFILDTSQIKTYMFIENFYYLPGEFTMQNIGKYLNENNLLF